jgi:hypothetical protein
VRSQELGVLLALPHQTARSAELVGCISNSRLRRLWWTGSGALPAHLDWRSVALASHHFSNSTAIHASMNRVDYQRYTISLAINSTRATNSSLDLLGVVAARYIHSCTGHIAIDKHTKNPTSRLPHVRLSHRRIRLHPKSKQICLSVLASRAMT